MTLTDRVASYCQDLHLVGVVPRLAGEGGLVWYDVSLLVHLKTVLLVLPISAGGVAITSAGWVVAGIILRTPGIIRVRTRSF